MLHPRRCERLLELASQAPCLGRLDHSERLRQLSGLLLANAEGMRRRRALAKRL
ncbi:hypothetical protein [Mumia zhuanghuii]|uniref:hypothetical protein n=1 Tax=Mumia zhuanghuii TaxID=2585211 RepID=UPI00129C9485|nr:hypothetical protein [Mumia zhuanghuii]